MNNYNESIDENSSYHIEFLDAILHHSFAAPLPQDDEDKSTNLSFNIEVSVHQKQIQVLLHLEYIIITDDEPFSGYGLKIGILGSLRASEDTPTEVLAEYGKVNSLTFLWPYAREYTSDLIRRMSIEADPLPIINPQIVTESLVEGGLITVEMLDK